MSVEEIFASVKEIEAALQRLSPGQRTELVSMLAEAHHDAWDEQIVADLEAGRLDKWLEEARKEYEAELAKPL